MLPNVGAFLFGSKFPVANTQKNYFLSTRFFSCRSLPAAVIRETGNILIAAEVAQPYGFKDIDEKQPRSYREESVKNEG